MTLLPCVAIPLHVFFVPNLQVGFYLLPPEPKFGGGGGGGSKKGGKKGSRKHQLDAIAEVSEESKTSTPGSSSDPGFDSLSPKLIR